MLRPALCTAAWERRRPRRPRIEMASGTAEVSASRAEYVTKRTQFSRAKIGVNRCPTNSFEDGLKNTRATVLTTFATVLTLICDQFDGNSRAVVSGRLGQCRREHRCSQRVCVRNAFPVRFPVRVIAPDVPADRTRGLDRCCGVDCGGSNFKNWPRCSKG